MRPVYSRLLAQFGDAAIASSRTSAAVNRRPPAKHKRTDAMDSLLQDVLAAIDADATSSVGASFTKLVAEYFEDTRAGNGRVSTAHVASELATRFDEPLPARSRSIADLVARLENDVLPDCNRLMHPRAMGHQVSAPLPVAVWMESLTAALNQSAAVWEMSPVGTIDRDTRRALAVRARRIRSRRRRHVHVRRHGGDLRRAAGRAQADTARRLAARRRRETLRSVVCGEHAHYAVARAVGQLGLGTDHAVVVPSRDFRMDVGGARADAPRPRRRGQRR